MKQNRKQRLLFEKWVSGKIYNEERCGNYVFRPARIWYNKHEVAVRHKLFDIMCVAISEETPFANQYLLSEMIKHNPKHYQNKPIMICKVRSDFIHFASYNRAITSTSYYTIGRYISGVMSSFASYNQGIKTIPISCHQSIIGTKFGELHDLAHSNGKSFYIELLGLLYETKLSCKETYILVSITKIFNNTSSHIREISKNMFVTRDKDEAILFKLVNDGVTIISCDGF